MPKQLHVCTCVYVCMEVYVCKCMFMCAVVCVFLHVYVYVCKHGCVYGCAYMGVCPYVCVQVGVLCTCTQALGEVLSHVIQKKSASYISLESLMVSSLSHRFHEHTCKQVSYLAVQFGRRDPAAGVCSPRAWLNTTLHSIHEVTGTAVCSVLDPGLRSSCASQFSTCSMLRISLQHWNPEATQSAQCENASNCHNQDSDTVSKSWR